MRPEEVMRSSIWDPSSVFCLRDSQSQAGALPEDRLHAAANRSGAAFSRELVESTITRRRRSGRPLAAAVSRALPDQQPTFFANLDGLAALVCVVIPKLVASRIEAQTMRFWVVGCETGQDVYSLAITLAELCPQLANWDIAIVATDPDSGAIARAHRAISTRSEVERGLPTEWLIRHFEELPAGRGWRFASPPRARITWLQLDAHESCAAVGIVDAIICRAALDESGHDSNGRRQLFRRLSDQLASDGFLILPGSTTDGKLEPGFESLSAGGAIVYRRVRPRDSLLSD
jgi:chemotaxis protein methyltransferase CheR